ncbi:MAG: hypothetical protein K9M75_05150 [Phycisphaerae bacterium]|nr:hypothetical protein [Phycisphaerae bacterium]
MNIAMDIAMKLFHWMLKRSHRASANPNPNPMPMPSQSTHRGYSQGTPIEALIEEDATIGINFSPGKQHGLHRGPSGELIRSHRNISILVGCNHIVSQLQASHEQGKSPVRGIAGKCIYCEKEFSKSVQKGQLDPFEAERMSLVCTDCARLTVSGVLCCPRHYVAVDNGNNQIEYLGPDEQAKQSRKQLVENILTPITGLFVDQGSSQLSAPGDNDE